MDRSHAERLQVDACTKHMTCKLWISTTKRFFNCRPRAVRCSLTKAANDYVTRHGKRVFTDTRTDADTQSHARTHTHADTCTFTHTHTHTLTTAHPHTRTLVRTGRHGSSESGRLRLKSVTLLCEFCLIEGASSARKVCGAGKRRTQI